MLMTQLWEVQANIFKVLLLACVNVSLIGNGDIDRENFVEHGIRSMMTIASIWECLLLLTN